MTELMDTALVFVYNKLNASVILYRQYTDCEKCPLLPSIDVGPNSTRSVRLSTKWDNEFSIRNNETQNFEYFNFVKSLWDQGKYQIIVEQTSNGITYSFETLESGRNNIWPIIGAIAFYILAAILWIVGLNAYRRYKSDRTVSNASDAPLTSEEKPGTTSANLKKKKRLKSLDCFRGIDMLMMIFVNFGAGGYYYLDHAPWNGLHFADVIFPWFIFMMGTSMAMSLRSQVVTHKKKILDVFWKITFRSMKLIGIGLLLATRGREPISLFRDILPYWIEWIFMLAFGLIYAMLTFVWHYDKSGYCPPGYLGPGGLHMNMTRWNCTGGAAHYIDVKVFTNNHIYQHTTSSELYNPDGIYHVVISHDPEGLLGCCTSIILTFLGLQVGKILVAYQQPVQRMARWMVWGLVLGGIAATLHFTKWEPINKNLWSFSFIGCTGGMGFIAITLLYYVVDVKNWWKNGQPFHFAGMNSILLYVGSEMTFSLIPWTFYINSSSHLPHLALNLWTATLWLTIAIVLARKKIFWTL
uniref:Heparan-alpha-glucosaminide N-acetyltransferase n=1 Tax=Acrobeloides nanus TaxID=290746 RepID=A0A914E4U6_9BILA